MGVQFQDFSVQVTEALNDAAIAYLYEAAGELEAQTKRNSQPGKKYRGRDAQALWTYAVNEGKKEATVGSPHEAAYWEELGTGEYALNNDGRKGWWVYVEGNDTPYPNQKQYSRDEAMGIAASMRADGLDAHATNGMEPNRPLYRAFTSLRTALIRRAEQVLKGLD
jgi:hypothetical protein